MNGLTRVDRRGQRAEHAVDRVVDEARDRLRGRAGARGTTSSRTRGLARPRPPPRIGCRRRCCRRCAGFTCRRVMSLASVTVASSAGTASGPQSTPAASTATSPGDVVPSSYTFAESASLTASRAKSTRKTPGPAERPEGPSRSTQATMAWAAATTTATMRRASARVRGGTSARTGTRDRRHRRFDGHMKKPFGNFRGFLDPPFGRLSRAFCLRHAAWMR